LDATKELKSI